MGGCCIKDNNNYITIMKSSKEANYLLNRKGSSAFSNNAESIHSLYIFKEKISKGFYGTVYKAYRKENPTKLYAVKAINKERISDEDSQGPLNEIKILSRLDHPNIIKYYETYDEPEFFFIVMELCSGGELFEFVSKNKKLPEKEAAKILFQIAHAISHCHSLGIVHRDLKAENILFIKEEQKDLDLRIVDFGLSRMNVIGNELKTLVGTPCYVAPEVISGNYSKKCDIWGLGIILYVMIYGRYPFEDPVKPNLYHKIMNEEPIYPSNNLSPEVIDLVKLLLSKDPKKRPDASEVIKHQWFLLQLKGYFKDSIKDLELVPDLRKYHPPNKFLKIIVTFMVREIAITEEIKRLYYILDYQNTGFVTLHRMDESHERHKIRKIKSLYSFRNMKGSSTSKINGTDELYSDCYLNKLLKNGNSGSSSSKSYSSNLIDMYKITKIDNDENDSKNKKIKKYGFSSYLMVILKEKGLVNENLIKNIFCKFDSGNIGFLNSEMFYKFIRRTGRKISQKEINNILKVAGFSDINFIQYEEFKNIVGNFVFS